MQRHPEGWDQFLAHRQQRKQLKLLYQREYEDIVYDTVTDHTCIRVAKLSANNSGIRIIPGVIADSTPFFTIAELNTTLILSWCGSSNKSKISIITESWSVNMCWLDISSTNFSLHVCAVVITLELTDSLTLNPSVLTVATVWCNWVIATLQDVGLSTSACYIIQVDGSTALPIEGIGDSSGI